MSRTRQTERSDMLSCQVYQTLSSGEPSYLFSMLSLAPKAQKLRSSGFHLLSVARVKTHAGTRAFLVAVHTLWN